MLIGEANFRVAFEGPLGAGPKREHTLARSKNGTASSKSLALIAVVLAIATLYVGRQIFIPLALALILSFILTPFVTLLQKLRFGRVPAVLTVLVLSFVLVGVLAWGVAAQLVEIMGELPNYKENLDAKIRALHAPKSGQLSRATATLQDLNKELAALPAQISANGAQESDVQGKEKELRSNRSTHPVPVQFAQPQSNLMEDLRDLLGPLAGPMETAIIVIIFTLFMLVKREDLRNRAIRLAGRGQIHLMTQAIDDAGRRLSRYLLLQCMVNAGYGILFGLGLYFAGVPHAFLWGASAAVLRFIPYLGSLIAAALPIALALAVFPGWHHALAAFAIFAVLELAVSNFVEPLLYGAHTGISSLAILVTTVFWATLWGPVGLILSTPLTVCLIVLGRHVPQLKFLEVVLGDEPVLLPEQCFYQRLLAMDPEEAREIAEAHLKANSLESLYDSIVLPTLKLAEQDYHHEQLDEGARRFILRNVKELIDNLSDEHIEPQPLAVKTDDVYLTGRLTDPKISESRIACIAASGGPDELVARMLGQLLRQDGYFTHEFRPGATEKLVQAVSHYKPGIVCISSIAPFAVADARLLCRRLRASACMPDVQIVMGLWSLENSTAEQRLGPGYQGAVVTNLSEAVKRIRELTHSPGEPDASAESPLQKLTV
jgi:predicted PurR-regulated permease PerM